MHTAERYEHSKAGLNAFPHDVGDKGPGLLAINLSWNNIADLPSGAFRRMLNVEEVDFSYNDLKVLPEEISVLNRLRMLDVQGNQIAFLPSSFERLNVEELYMAFNQVRRRAESATCVPPGPP